MTLNPDDPLITTLDSDQVHGAAQDMTAALHRVAKQDMLKLVAASLAVLLGSASAFLYWSWHGLDLWLFPSADLSGESLAAILMVLSYPPREAFVDGRIHSATNDDRALFVALRPSGRSIQIEMATPWATNATLIIHPIYEWLSQPVALAKALFQAERTLHGKR